LERLISGTGVKPRAVPVDALYVTACNPAICDQAGILLYGPWKENDFSKKDTKPGGKPRPIGKEQFSNNIVRCANFPEGASFAHNGKWG
jgi:hypothetical protein